MGGICLDKITSKSNLCNRKYFHNILSSTLELIFQWFSIYLIEKYTIFCIIILNSIAVPQSLLNIQNPSIVKLKNEKNHNVLIF